MVVHMRDDRQAEGSPFLDGVDSTMNDHPKESLVSRNGGSGPVIGVIIF